jgi:hypothetical protein
MVPRKKNSNFYILLASSLNVQSLEAYKKCRKTAITLQNFEKFFFFGISLVVWVVVHRMLKNFLL